MKIEELNIHRLPMDTGSHCYVNSEKINEIVKWINGLQKVAKKELRGH